MLSLPLLHEVLLSTEQRQYYIPISQIRKWKLQIEVTQLVKARLKPRPPPQDYIDVPTMCYVIKLWSLFTVEVSSGKQIEEQEDAQPAGASRASFPKGTGRTFQEMSLAPRAAGAQVGPLRSVPHLNSAPRPTRERPSPPKPTANVSGAPRCLSWWAVRMTAPGRKPPTPWTPQALRE